MTDFYAGLDLGQAADPSALTIIESIERDESPRYHLRHAHRYELGTAYPEIVRNVGGLLQQAPLKGSAALVIDATGVGRPVVDMFREAGLRPVSVYITGGDSVTEDGYEWRVPKRDLASTVQALLQSGRLKFAEELPFREVLREELQKFRAKINIQTGHASFEHWREHDTDDLVLSLAIGLWYAENRPKLPPAPKSRSWNYLTGEGYRG